jgi:uncharacterized protein YndB with AHSA1/START domain
VSDAACKPVRVSRRIAAPAASIFKILADPDRHRDIDGSGTLRGAAPGAVISGLEDMFVMRMHDPRIGDFEMNNHVVEYEPGRRVGWEPENGRGHPDAGTPETGRWRRWSFELTPDGPDATTVTEIYDCCQGPEDARAELANGTVMIESMKETLTRLDALCAT